MRALSKAATASLLALAFLSGCSSGSSEEPSTPSESEAQAQAVEEEPEEVVETYIDVAVEKEPYSLGPAVAVEGSPAWDYLRHLEYMGQAIADGGMGYPEPDYRVSKKSDTDFEVCGGGDCFTLSDFVMEDGKVRTFSINEVAIEGQVAADRGLTFPLGNLGTAEIISSYQSPISNNLLVTARITSGPERSITTSYMASYRGPDKRQSQSGMDSGPMRQDADATSLRTYSFAGANFGGEITITVGDENSGSYEMAEGTGPTA